MNEINQRAILRSMRFGCPVERVFGTVRDAAGAALAEIEENSAAPDAIIEDGLIAWSRGDRFFVYDDLARLAGRDPDA